MTAVAAFTWPDHLLTLTEWDELDEQVSRRAELVEGVLVVSPSPTGRHQHLGARLMVALADQLRLPVTVDVEVLTDDAGAPTVRRPDVVVLQTGADLDRYRYDPADVLAVFEILSPGTRRTDRIAKLADYAEAGIPHYGIVDPGPPAVLTEFVLEGDAYRRVTEHRGSAPLALGAVVDLETLP